MSLTAEDLKDLERYNALRYSKIWRTPAEDAELARLEAKLGL